MQVTPVAIRSLDSALTSRWGRLLVPSLSDMFFITCLASLCRRGGEDLLRDADAGWHIRTGEYILTRHAIPHRDLYSFSKAGEAWYAWEWLSDIVLGATHRSAGLKGIVLLTAVVLALFVVSLVRRMTARGAHLWSVLAITLLSVDAAAVHFFARPHVITLLLMSGAMWLIESDREQPSARIWWLVPLTALWTNLHGGFVAVLAVLGITAAGSFVEGWLAEPRDFGAALRYSKLTAACAAATLVNPYGWTLHWHIQRYLRARWLLNSVQEFMAPTFRGEGTLAFEVLLGLGLVVAGFAWRKRRIVEGSWIVCWAHLALTSARHIPLFIAVCAPLMAAQLSEWLRTSIDERGGALMRRLDRTAGEWALLCSHTSLLPWLVVGALALLDTPIRWAQDFPARDFPTQLVHQHAALLLRSRVLTTDQWADYLIYVHPQQKVFVDGRSDFYGETLGERYLELSSGHWRWRKWLKQYDFDVALLPLPSPLTELLKREPGWRVVVDDGEHVLFQRDAPSS